MGPGSRSPACCSCSSASSCSGATGEATRTTTSTTHEHGGERVAVAPPGPRAGDAAHRSGRAGRLLARSHRFGRERPQRRRRVRRRSIRGRRPTSCRCSSSTSAPSRARTARASTALPCASSASSAPTKGEGFLVARYSIACCAADALAATARVVGWDGPVPQRDTWVQVEGTFEPGDEAQPAARRDVGDADPEARRPLRVIRQVDGA